MKPYIIERTLNCANYIIDNKATIRETANKFGVSKSTVSLDLLMRLPVISPNLYTELRPVIEKNKAERHLRGGMATGRKYRK